FGYRLGWFPTSGTQTLGLQRGLITQWIDRLKYILLPSITQAFLATADTIQYLRSEVIDSKSLDFDRTARSKGVPTNKV
ncbi:ABC transporter permease, partial [Enterococcus faecium]